MRKILLTIMMFITALVLVACQVDKVTSFEVRLIDDNKKEIIEGETLDLDDFELVLYYEKGEPKVISYEQGYVISHNYNNKPEFNHFDQNDNRLVQQVIFYIIILLHVFIGFCRRQIVVQRK